MSDGTKNRSPEYIQEKVDAMNASRRGQIETDEQRQRKSNAIIKWMSENPQRVFNTKPEIFFKEWLKERKIDFKQQFTIDGVNHPYDFYLLKYNTIVEIDGPHHWSHAIWGTSGKITTRKKYYF